MRWEAAVVVSEKDIVVGKALEEDMRHKDNSYHKKAQEVVGTFHKMLRKKVLYLYHNSNNNWRKKKEEEEDSQKERYTAEAEEQL